MEIYKLTPLTSLVWFQEGPGVRNTQYTNSGVKLLNVANLIDGHIDLSTSNRYIAEEEAYGRYRHFLCDKGDLVIASSGIKVDYFDKKMGFVRQEHLPLCMNTSTIRFKVLDKNILNIRYFMYFLKSNFFKSQLSKQITGSAQLNFGPSHLKRMIVPLINIDYQNHICGILDKVYELEYKLQTELTLLNQLVKSRFLEMFGDIQHNPCKWDIEPLSAVCHKITDGEHGSVQRVSEGYVYLNAKNIRQDGNIDWENITHISFKDHAKIFKRCNPEPDDILLTTTGTVGNIAIVPKVGPFSIDRGITLLKINNDRLNNIYLANLLNSEYLQQCMKNNIHASAIGHLFLKQVKSLSVMLPPLHLQNQFADYVVHIDKSKYRGTISLHLLEDVSHML